MQTSLWVYRGGVPWQRVPFFFDSVGFGKFLVPLLCPLGFSVIARPSSSSYTYVCFRCCGFDMNIWEEYDGLMVVGFVGMVAVPCSSFC
jgi:hypothetical protein